MSIDRGTDEENIAYIYNEIFLSNKKGWNCAICDNIGKPRGYYAKWNKSEKDKHCMVSLICGIFKKQSKWNKNRLIETEIKWWLPEGRRVWGGKRGRVISQ